MNPRAATVGLLLLAASAFPAEDKVVVTAEVVTLSKTGDVVDPPKLAAMKAQFQKQAATKEYTSFKRVSEKRLELRKGKPEMIDIAAGRQAKVQLDELKADTATVTVDVPQLVVTKLTLGKKGVVYQHLGAQGEDALVLVLTPAQ